ncbi:MAG: O-antigen ligase domain-containing protein [Alistipes sp.]
MESQNRIRSLFGNVNSVRVVLLAVLLMGCWGLIFATLNFGLVGGVAVAMVPCALMLLICTIRNPVYALFGLFVVNYFIMGVARYLHDLPLGTLLDALIVYNFMVLLFHSFTYRVSWWRAFTWLTLMAFIWLLYGVMELVNPETVSVSGWFSSVRSVSFHFFFLVVLTQIIMDDYRYLRYMLYIWSVLTLLGVAKGLMQKFIGFDNGELYWLFVLGGSTTHFIGSGVRYFSFFSDAASFGAAMGLAMVVFSTAALHFHNKLLKVYLLFVAAVACYGMLISGTRSALAIPFVGFVLYVIMSKRIKIIVLGALAIGCVFYFLNFTYIGQGNALIRRARSAFDPSDKSLVVRLENQQKLRVLMADLPFGAGIGHGGGKAKVFAPDAPISQIPTDSWFVMIWVETGPVGVVLHLLILFVVLFYGGFLVMFRLQNAQLRGIIAGLTAGLAGVMAMSYANEVLGQIPMGVILYMSMAFIFLSPQFDKQLTGENADKS